LYHIIYAPSLTELPNQNNFKNHKTKGGLKTQQLLDQLLQNNKNKPLQFGPVPASPLPHQSWFPIHAMSKICGVINHGDKFYYLS
jgi:hypothetical protein